MESLVRRELDFVYACALRQARFDSHLAQDITQAVFILLARKSGTFERKLRANVNLRDWLFVTTRYVAKNALKMAAPTTISRATRGGGACNARVGDSSDDRRSPSPLRDQLSPMIDEAIARLSSSDRAGVLLSFFDNKTYREVGMSLGVSEDAARKRVNRAIDKMRAFFASRGVAVDGAAGAVVFSAARATRRGSAGIGEFDSQWRVVGFIRSDNELPAGPRSEQDVHVREAETGGERDRRKRYRRRVERGAARASRRAEKPAVSRHAQLVRTGRTAIRRSRSSTMALRLSA